MVRKVRVRAARMLNQGRNRKRRGRGLLPSPSLPLFSPGISYFTNHPKNRQRRRLLGIRFVPCLFRSSLSPGRLLWGGGFWAEERLILQAIKEKKVKRKVTLLTMKNAKIRAKSSSSKSFAFAKVHSLFLQVLLVFLYRKRRSK